MTKKKCFFYCIIDPLNTGLSDGGGGQTARNIIDNFQECDYEVTIITPKDKFIDPNEGDFNVYKDIFNDPLGAVGWFSKEQYEQLLLTKTPYLFSECAYTACTTKTHGYTNGNYNESMSDLARQFINNAHKTVLVSPLQQEEIERFIHQPIENVYHYLCEIDTSLFYNKDQERDIEYLFIGTFNYFKGTDLIIQQYHDKGLVMGGFGEIPANFGKAKFLGKIHYLDTPNLYNKAKNFVHLPRSKETFSRNIAEASLCGCKIITNGNIGALSWRVDLSDPKIYKESKARFKEMINGYVYN